jgi:D-psicose/D-tagatose/L-ribulose 3-epimerase
MKVGMHNWMRPEPLDVTLARLQKLGYDGIEIMGEPRKYDVKDTLKLLKKYKIECYGSVTIMIKGRDLIHGDVYYREMSLQYVKECIDLVANLGGTLLTLVPSEVGKVVAMADQETEWKWAVEGIRKAADHAAKKKVKIGLEPLNRFETNFLNNHKQALRLASEVGDDVGVCLDAFHINIEEEDPYEAVTATAKAGKLVDFHVADNNRFPPGGGNWDWKKLISTLKKAGYDGWITSEFVVPMDRSPLAKKAEAAGTTATEAELKFIRDHGSDLMSDAAYSKYVEDTIKTLKKAGV